MFQTSVAGKIETYFNFSNVFPNLCREELNTYNEHTSSLVAPPYRGEGV
jgi:hypothetical protein